MADNIVLNLGSGGATLATHEGSAISAAGLAQFELVQLVTGVGLTKTFVGSANPFPVFLAGQVSATQNVHISSISPTVNVNIASISATVNVNIAAQSATLNVGIASISPTVNVNIAAQSATLQVRIAQSTSAGVNIGIVDRISATVDIRIVSQSATLNVQSTEELSSTFTVTTISATPIDTIIAAPGVASSIRVFSIMVTNKSTTRTRVKFAESASTAIRVMGDAALGGGGFFWKPRRSWLLPVNSALTGIASPAASNVVVTVEYVIQP